MFYTKNLIVTVLACYNSKGGVGKTSASVNLAYAASLAGNQTLLIDLDQQSASSYYFRVRPRKKHGVRIMTKGGKNATKAIRESDYPNLDLLPAHESYRDMDALLTSMKRSSRRLADFLDQIESNYDAIILDCPPSLSMVAANVFRAVDHLLIPIVPTTLSVRTYAQLKKFFGQPEYRRKKLHPFFSMVEYRKRLHRDTIEFMRNRERRLLNTENPYSAQIESMGIHREPVLVYAAEHPAAQAFSSLWQEVSAL